MANNKQSTIKILILLVLLAFSYFGVASYFLYQDIDQKTRRCYLGFGFFMPDTQLFSGTRIRRNRKMLNLSREQTADINKLILDIKEFYIKNYAKLKIAELELVNLLKNQKPSRQGIKKKVKALGNLRTLMAIRQMEYLVTINNILSSKQKEILKNIK
jgi:Spy/CpxP family protein refolding chaperone